MQPTDVTCYSVTDLPRRLCNLVKKSKAAQITLVVVALLTAIGISALALYLSGHLNATLEGIKIVNVETFNFIESHKFWLIGGFCGLILGDILYGKIFSQPASSMSPKKTSKRPKFRCYGDI